MTKYFLDVLQTFCAGLQKAKHHLKDSSLWKPTDKIYT